MKGTTRLLALAMALTCCAPALAEVSAEEAKQLGGPVLTLFGAEKAGNAEGTIPPYTGAGVKVPADWDPKDPGQRPDPYGEKPLFSITAQNAAQYADKLDGMVEMFKRYPDFRMDIYPSHRDVVFPQYLLDNTVKNATACKAVNNELKLQGCYGGRPFPIPKTGNQAMWNHLVNYNVLTLSGKIECWMVPPTDEPYLIMAAETMLNWPFYDPAKKDPIGEDTLYWRYLDLNTAPARMAGNRIMLLDPVDQLNKGRRAYMYVPGRRWTKLAADLAYDTTGPYSGGTATMDDTTGFAGALDRYDFKLLGKKEKYIYYNNFQMFNRKLCATEKLHSTKGFPHPDCVRWELHRVWVVEATVKRGSRHLYPKRILYWDEDTFGAGMSENYDADGKLYRTTITGFFPFYEELGGYSYYYFHHDLRTGSYASQGNGSCPKCGVWPVPAPSETTYSPEGMAGSGIR